MAIHHDSVTATWRTEAGRSGAEACRVLSDAGAAAPGRRLEDVEKFVRNHDREIEALIECVSLILDRLSEFGVPYTE